MQIRKFWWSESYQEDGGEGRGGYLQASRHDVRAVLAEIADPAEFDHPCDHHALPEGKENNELDAEELPDGLEGLELDLERRVEARQYDERIGHGDVDGNQQIDIAVARAQVGVMIHSAQLYEK